MKNWIYVCYIEDIIGEVRFTAQDLGLKDIEYMIEGIEFVVPKSHDCAGRFARVKRVEKPDETS